jgi:hypothetical protein
LSDYQKPRKPQDNAASRRRKRSGLRLSLFGKWMVIAVLFSIAAWAVAFALF